MEAFATNFAGLTSLYCAYPAPGKLDWVDITETISYKAYSQYSASEEFDIASLLFYLHSLVGDTAKYWKLIKDDHNNFKEYYDLFKAALPADKAVLLEDYAYRLGLYTMPEGNGKYDMGEPCKDTNKDGILQNNEPYGDLAFAVKPDGFIDKNKPLKTYLRSDLNVGTVSPANKARQTLAAPVDCSLTVEGSVPEYLLVKIETADGVTSALRAVWDGSVQLGLPGESAEGTVTVSVPGGKAIYSGDLAELCARRQEHPNQPVPLDTADISDGDLAPEGTITVATYGDGEATGVLQAHQLTPAQLSGAAHDYNPKAPAAQVVAEHTGAGQTTGGGQTNSVSPKPGGGSTSPKPGIYTPEPDIDQGILTTNYGPVIVIIVAVVVLAAAAILIIVLITRGKKKPAARGPMYGAPQSTPPANLPHPPMQTPPPGLPEQHAQNQSPPPMRPGESVPQPPPPARFCTGCGDPLAPGERFCTKCGRQMR